MTRADIDSTRLGYIAMSFGAGSRLVFAAADPRFRAVVLLGVDAKIKQANKGGGGGNPVP